MTFFTELIFEKAKCSINAADCALIIGVTYFLSSILGLVLKKHIGRRVLLLVSELGMAAAQLSMVAYFQLNSSYIRHSSLQSRSSSSSSSSQSDNFYSTTESSFPVAATAVEAQTDEN